LRLKICISLELLLCLLLGNTKRFIHWNYKLSMIRLRERNFPKRIFLQDNLWLFKRWDSNYKAVLSMMWQDLPCVIYTIIQKK
jgi:hypothetical protein